MEKKLICIECPRGCELTAELMDGKVSSVTGNFCVKGEMYAKTELTMPLRVITTTIRLLDGRVLPVKTDRGVLKTEIFNIMKIINKVTASAPIKIGQILAENLDGNGVNLVAAKNC